MAVGFDISDPLNLTRVHQGTHNHARDLLPNAEILKPGKCFTWRNILPDIPCISPILRAYPPSDRPYTFMTLLKAVERVLVEPLHPLGQRDGRYGSPEILRITEDVLCQPPCILPCPIGMDLPIEDAPK